MLKFLSKTKGQQGFTLVELLVAIAIIAILAVIGLTVFTGLQRGARDATRRSDVQAISKALEANYTTTSAIYAPLMDTHFAGGVKPQDPLNGSTTACNTNLCSYCVNYSTGGGANPTGAIVTSTPTCGTGGGGTSLFQRSTADSTVPGANATGYIVCTNLETGATSGPTAFYCQGNQR